MDWAKPHKMFARFLFAVLIEMTNKDLVNVR